MDEEITTVHITENLSSAKIIELIEEYPNLNTITCCPSIFKRISKSYIEALDNLDIVVEKKYNWGNKSIYSYQEDSVLELAKDGFKASEIAEKLNIPLSRVYALVRKSNDKFKFNSYQRKHDDNQRELVRSLKNQGKSAKSISSQLDIPLRSVYYILNKK